jgi:hypothetical protein
VGTFTVERIAGLAAQADAKTLLVDDWAQLQAVEAGGAFSLPATHRDDAPELFDIHRFRHDWEKAASLGLRHGHAEAIDAYHTHGRFHDGNAEAMHYAAYTAWRQGLTSGRSSILVADDRRTVAALNARAREDRIHADLVDTGRSVALAEGASAAVGDLVITRRNDRRLTAGKTGWVRNGDRWTVTAIHRDGSVAVQQACHSRGATVVPPVCYAAESLDLGYAVTAFRAQGVAVDTARVIATSGTSRENLYVALTRGREANHVYVATDAERAEVDALRPEPVTAAEVLAQALRTSGAELSAHQAQQSEEAHWNSLAQWAAEYRAIAAAAKPTREQMLAAAKGTAIRQRQSLVVGLIPEPTWPVTADLQMGLTDPKTRIEQRAKDRLAAAIRANEPWLASLGPVPTENHHRSRWRAAALTVAAYRDMYGIDSDQPLGRTPTDPVQRVDHARARQTITTARERPTPPLAPPPARAPRHSAPVLGL